jgi:hypothetical protein
MQLAPIVIFTYNRPWHTQQVLDSLALNEEAKDSLLYIYCDGAKDNAEEKIVKEINQVRLIAKSEHRFKQVIVKEQPKNKGLANSIIDGVTEIVNKHGFIIVLEDDIIVSNYFLKYMNEALLKYELEEMVISISAYIYPINNLPTQFLIKGADCWGWATWKRGWGLFEYDGKKLLNQLEKKKLTHSFDFNDSYPFTQMLKNQINGKNNSWAIRWHASAFLNNKLTLYPNISLVNNIGFDGSGTHSGNEKHYKTGLLELPMALETLQISENIDATRMISSYFKTLNFDNSNKLYIIKTNIKKIIPEFALKLYTYIFNNNKQSISKKI